MRFFSPTLLFAVHLLLGKMKFILAALCFFLAVSQIACDEENEMATWMLKYRSVLREVNQALEKAIEGAEHVQKEGLRAGIDPVKCANDSSALTRPEFLACQNFIESSDESPEGARTFCEHHCPRMLLNLLHRITVDCGLPSDDLPDNMTLLGACAMNPQTHKYCVELFATYFSDSANTSRFDPSYQQCVQQYDGVGACPTICKTAEDWVTRTFGCCYRTIIEVSASEGSSEGVLDDKYWNICGKKEPPPCPMPRNLSKGRTMEELL